MSEGSRRCYHKIWTWGVKTGCLCLALLHSVASGRGREQRRARGALSFEGRFQTCPYGRGRGGREGFTAEVFGGVVI